MPAKGGPHAPQAFALGEKLLDPEGEIQLFQVVTDDLTPESEAAAMQILRETAEAAGGNGRVVPRVVHA